MKRAQVVFVDDEPKVCSAVSRTLACEGLDVQCFQRAADCLAHLTRESCDLLVTDVKMPGKDGMQLLCDVKKHLPWLPVLVVTGYGDVPLAVRAMRAGAADFLEKPLDRDTFLRVVRCLLKRSPRLNALEKCALTRAEMRVLYMILDGKNNREVAAALHRSPRTIEVHRGHVMQKLGAGNIIELLHRAADLGLLPSNKPGEGWSTVS